MFYCLDDVVVVFVCVYVIADRPMISFVLLTLIAREMQRYTLFAFNGRLEIWIFFCKIWKIMKLIDGGRQVGTLIILLKKKQMWPETGRKASQ